MARDTHSRTRTLGDDDHHNHRQNNNDDSSPCHTVTSTRLAGHLQQRAPRQGSAAAVTATATDAPALASGVGTAVTPGTVAGCTSPLPPGPRHTPPLRPPRLRQGRTARATVGGRSTAVCCHRAASPPPNATGCGTGVTMPYPQRDCRHRPRRSRPAWHDVPYWASPSASASPSVSTNHLRLPLRCCYER